MTSRPEFLLFTEALRQSSGQLMWRMLLLEAGSDHSITASDEVDEDSVTRAELLAVVRGLEALDGPANVRLFTGSGYVSRGFSRDLPHWRAQHWHWERFGRRVPIRDSDLWQRVDRALEFHLVDCRPWGEPSLTGAEAVVGATEAPVEDLSNKTTTRIDEPSILVVPKRPRRRRGSRIAAASRSTLSQLRRGLETLVEPALLPTG
ncbi:RNase H family protein [Aeoliella mucimassa]|uniref:Ribonuclease HI n=1 Tax=Aeoliella mucimassa TaxID=2527972 RepID=A0A518ATA7_9BACT|nr:RNase H family protein [Aeoliella mucimassa]QDU57963.1 Ribonuclease HI [Aeoliella mucimassa]